MKRLFGLDQCYEQLKQLDLLDPSFAQFSVNLLRKYAQTMMSTNDKKSHLREILEIFHKSNKSSQQTLKSLIFINIVIHMVSKNDATELSDIINKAINNLVQIQRIRYEKVSKHKPQRTGSSLERTASWLKTTFSRSKDKLKFNQRKSNTIINNQSQIRGRVNSQMSQNLQFSSVKESSNQQINQIKTKQQLLISKIIIPYSSYLLKLNASQINFTKIEDTSTIRTQHLWTFINFLKNLLKISQKFPVIMRYYSQFYTRLVCNVIKALDFDLKIFYPIVSKTVSNKIQIVKKEIVEIYQKCDRTKKKVQLFQQVISKYELIQLKQILKEITLINQSILSIYLGKYTYENIRGMSLTQPALLLDSQGKFDIVFDVFKEVQRGKSVNKRLSSSKQKSSYNFNTQSQKSQQQLGYSTSQLGKKPVLAQKKLKLIPQIQRRKNNQPQKIAPPNTQIQNNNKHSNQKPDPEGSTFRRMRMSVTNSTNQQSNTRRLRL